MANPYYVGGSYPATGAPGSSSPARSEFADITAGFDKLPTLSGNADKAVVINSGGTGMTVTTGTLALAGNFSTTGAFNTVLAQSANITLTLPGSSQTIATLAGTETFTNKTVTAPVLSGTITGTYTLAGTPTITSPTINTPTIPATEWTNATHTHAGASTGGQIATSSLTGHDRTAHDALGTGAIVFEDETQTLSAKTLTTPTISSTGFTNAQHAHAAANSGGQIAIANTTGTVAVSRGGSGATTLTGILIGNGTSAFTADAVPLSATNGGTNNQFFQVSGPASSIKTYTFPNVSDTVVLLGETQTLTAKTLTDPIITITTVAPATPTANRIYEDSIVKGWVRFQVDGTIDDDLNVSSITDNATGDWSVNWATAFANGNYGCNATAQSTGDRIATISSANTPTTTVMRILMVNGAGSAQDPTGTTARIHAMAIGNQ